MSLSALVRSLSPSTVISSLVILLVLRALYHAIYNIVFHPLAKFPGPKLSAASRLPYARAAWKGGLVKYVNRLHQQYGDVVRISPDELSFINPDAWKDVHGFASSGRPHIPSKHWGRYSRPPNDASSMIVAREDEHVRMRKIFAPAFSDRALKQQEPIFMKYVNLLLQKLNDAIQKDPRHVFDMVRMYNFTTFDVMGDLTFGEPLNMLEKGEYIPWVSIIFSSIRTGQRVGLLIYYPWLKSIFDFFLKKKMWRSRYEHAQFAADRVTRRLEKASEHPDIWNLVLAQEGESGLNRLEMDSNSSLFMIAGTETTATLLSGLTYLLLTNPDKMKKLVDEIRGAFRSDEDIHMDGLARLPYLHACTEEGLRLYPPVAGGMPRLTGPAGSTICGRYVPPNTTLSVFHYPMYTSPKYFKDPLSFIPERWTGEDERFAEDCKFALQPFSYGPRNCLGKNMAYHEMRLILAKVLYNFDLELCPETGDWRDQAIYTVWEKKPLLVRMKPAQRV